MRGRRIVVAVVGTALIVAAVVTVLKVRRDHEWAHGGDNVTVSARIRVTDAAGLPATVAALGGPSRAADPFLPAGDQAVVVDIRWHGPVQRDGRYNLLVLDNRVHPPQPLRPYQAWGRPGDVVFGWDGRYEALGTHYGWLGRTRQAESGGSLDAAAVPAVADGALTVAFLLAKDGISDRDALIGLFLDRGGEPRWAKPVVPVGG